jgi:hypothetical protein
MAAVGNVSNDIAPTLSKAEGKRKKAEVICWRSNFFILPFAFLLLP